MPTITRSIEIKATPATVWSLLSTQEGLRQWWAPNFEIDFRLGGAHRHISPGTDQLITGTVLEMVPERLLILSWFEDGEGTDWRHPIRLTFTLEPTASGTRVTTVFDGYPGIGIANWERTYAAYEIGVDRHDLLGHLCRTVQAHAT